MKIFTFDDDFNLLSLLYLGEVISTQLLKLPSSDEISWWQCNVIIGTLSQTVHWKWTRVAFIFDRYSIKNILLRKAIFDILKVYFIYVKQKHVSLYNILTLMNSWLEPNSFCISFASSTLSQKFKLRISCEKKSGLMKSYSIILQMIFEFPSWFKIRYFSSECIWNNESLQKMVSVLICYKMCLKDERRKIDAPCGENFVWVIALGKQ